MKKWKIFIALIFFAGIFCCANAQQKSVPWNHSELMAPADLSAAIKNNNLHPIIFDIGPAGVIKGAIFIGPAAKKEGIQKLKNELMKLKPTQQIIIYCGCCPFDNCPNIRPAYDIIKDQGFPVKVLNLSNNLKADWIDKGYPMQ